MANVDPAQRHLPVKARSAKKVVPQSKSDSDSESPPPANRRLSAPARVAGAYGRVQHATYSSLSLVLCTKSQKASRAGCSRLEEIWEGLPWDAQRKAIVAEMACGNAA